MRGLILFAHGARDPRWAEPFEHTAALVRQLDPDRQVLNAYLEFMAPGLEEAGRVLVSGGCSVVDILPMFLGSGGHVRKDLPDRWVRLRSLWPEVDWRLHPAIGESPALASTMAQIAHALDAAPRKADQ